MRTKVVYNEIQANPYVELCVSSPIFEVLYLEEAKAVITDFRGNPPKEYNL